MANFGIILEPDPTRRAIARRALTQRIAPYPHLEVHEVEMGDAVLAWALSPEAPRRVIQRDDEIVLVLGHMVGDDGKAEPDLNRIEDGFHIVIRVTRTGEVQVRPDLLGLFPIYYGKPRTGSFLVGSSPFLFPAHPDFRIELEPRAVIGLLYGNTVVGGRSLYRGVNRLKSGHGLRYRHSPDQGIEQVPIFRIPISDRLHYVAARECVAQVGDALSNACARHLEAAGTSPVTLLLSGGYDSRILAATIAGLGREFRAVTLGQRSDVEAQCAALVARSLGVEHQIIDRPFAPEWFAMTLRWDSLVSSPGTGGMWSMVDAYREFGPWLVSGYIMDTILGIYEPVGETSGFEAYFRHMSRSGFPFGVLKKLLRPDVFGDGLEEVHQELVAEFQDIGTNDLERAYRHPLLHRMRFHTGGPLWKHCFGSWPVVPFLDRSVMETAGACPLTLLADRDLEQRLIRQRFPRLVPIPLDRNAFRTQSLDPRVRDLVTTEIRERAIALMTRLTGGLWRRKERRQFHRNYNFNGSAWRWIRREMESHRDMAFQLFDRTTFDALLPPAEAEWRGKNSIEPAAGMKSLLGIIGWLREFSPAIGRA